MKKTLLAILATVAMVACSNDEIVREAAPEAIGFDNAFIDNATRSIVDPSLTVGTLNDFAVYGYVENGSNSAVLFDGIRVYKKDGVWKYDVTQYWIEGATYNFNAVAPKPETGGNWTKTAADAASTTISFTNDGDTDLLYAMSTEITGQASGSNNPVAFTFRHALSKVKFSFTNNYDATNSSIRIKEVKITDAYATGTAVLANSAAWSGQTGTLVLSFGDAVVDDTDTVADAFKKGEILESYNELFLIPGEGYTDVPVTNADGTSTTKKGYTITFTVELLMNNGLLATYPHTVYTTFVPEAGKAYDLAAVINYKNIDPDTKQDPIVFTVTEIIDWDNDHDGEENKGTGTDDEDNQVDTEI